MVVILRQPMEELWISFLLVGSAFAGKRNDYAWPRKHHVVSSDYTLWRKAMKFLFPNDLQLLQPLGEWIITSDAEWLDNWDWFLSEDREFLYFRLDSSTWHRFLRLPHAHRGYNEESLMMHDHPIGCLYRATVCSRENGIHLLSAVHRTAPTLPAEDIQQLVTLQLGASFLTQTNYTHHSINL